MIDAKQVLSQAEQLLGKNDVLAAEKYIQIIGHQDTAAIACFRLGEICNRMGDAPTSYAYHTKAFQLNPSFSKLLVKDEHPSHSYSYKKPDKEIVVPFCPLCGGDGTPHSAYNTVTSLDYIPGFDPIRLWMHCEQCHHLYASRYPENLGELLSGSAFEFNLNPKTHLLPTIGNIVMNLSQHVQGPRLLEVGVGAGEFSAVAKEYLFDVTGLDIRPKYAQAVSEMLNIPVYTDDFQQYRTDDKYDLIAMGDVIEHMSDPVGAISKARELLSDHGVLWISTPNYESAFSMIKKDSDPMWRIIEHLNYFSFRSLSITLNRLGFKVVQYSISGHYNGSMEVTAIKE
ncbi:Methyltransferase type 12 [Paenibacillus curdlanolyticus YK9]|uniref:Methyltransferase type 12 n=1 Tax=Paenibacillus curdlanolyticus YK9 TaxID=717606 RepID=E0IEC0_9BACL|nr:class I SAM-dependent methyltransferase [Paenibacillus curdlanolyticus]EFM09008.1 Methyltransferase type 12 [Paenibacillus curdlanolyticus YK9]